MSGETLRPDPSAAVGEAVEVLTKAGTGWLMGQPPIAVFAIVMLVFVLAAGYWTVDHVIPNHLQKINDGYSHQAAEYDKSLDKVIATFKENSDRHEKHVKEILDIMRDDRKPIAVNPIGVGS